MPSPPFNTLPSPGPDVTVVVGTEEFQEHSRELCCWSDYFHAAFRSGMAETRSLRFEFKERDPEEWKLVQSLTKPFPTARITKDNMAIALSWFDELRCERGLMECDRVLNATVKLLLRKSMPMLMGNVNYLLKTLSTSLQYGLGQTKRNCIACLVRVIEEVPPKALTEERLPVIITCMINDEDCSNRFWNGLSRYLPSSLTGKNKEALLRNECLPTLLLSQIQNSVKEGHLRRMYEIGAGLSLAGGEFRERVKQDAILCDY